MHAWGMFQYADLFIIIIIISTNENSTDVNKFHTIHW